MTDLTRTFVRTTQKQFRRPSQWFVFSDTLMRLDKAQTHLKQTKQFFEWPIYMYVLMLNWSTLYLFEKVLQGTRKSAKLGHFRFYLFSFSLESVNLVTNHTVSSNIIHLSFFVIRLACSNYHLHSDTPSIVMWLWHA